MQSFTCSKIVPVWPENLSSFGICKLFGRKARCRTLGFIFFVVGLAQSPAFATGNVTLAWNACTGSNIAGYNIYYGGACGTYTNKICAGTSTNVIVSGLVEGTTYYFAATTYSASGTESPFSSEMSYLVPNLVVLSFKAVKTNGILSSVTVTATNGVASHWVLQSSTDLKTWATIKQGTNQPVNVSLATGSLPMQFFRLLNQ
jgi:hypothetical protein